MNVIALWFHGFTWTRSLSIERLIFGCSKWIPFWLMARKDTLEKTMSKNSDEKDQNRFRPTFYARKWFLNSLCRHFYRRDMGFLLCHPSDENNITKHLVFSIVFATFCPCEIESFEKNEEHRKKKPLTDCKSNAPDSECVSPIDINIGQWATLSITLSIDLDLRRTANNSDFCAIYQENKQSTVYNKYHTNGCRENWRAQ